MEQMPTHTTKDTARSATRDTKGKSAKQTAKRPARKHAVKASHPSVAGAHPHTSSRAKFVVAYRLFYAALAIVAIAAQYSKSTGHFMFKPANFFSYFTIESNLLAIAAFIAGAWFIAVRKPLPRWFSLFRGATTVYMVLTAIIFAALLRGTSVQNDFSVDWADNVMHVVFPVIVALDWLLVPPHRSISWKQAAWWLAFPLLWLAYTLGRGTLTNWYPYPFLVPSTGGYIRVAGYCLLVAAAILTIGTLVKLVPALTPMALPKPKEAKARRA